ncbi:hypothetical protein RAS12_29810 [Achromobacter seleniivolatilans]|uniref:Uncharacterized protein n=1 Tax=Achromobacter seleniivolatilans TaxID=3047478 RepID=A0ABY9M171_9BURK|nr:hypothetical protein [Achromobacter sp. R39]WMD20737.1 hypothetical protein RAS12_29810 [Achromobacter sp. R39]
MKKLAIVAAMSLFAATAYASGPSVPTVSLTGHAGTINGTATSISTGSSVVATQINGYGSSTQTSFGETGGVAQVSGSFNRDGTQVTTSTRQYATSESYGHVTGNAPIMVGDSIANGGASFGKTDTTASATGTFVAGNIGAFGSISGVGSVGHIGGFNH